MRHQKSYSTDAHNTPEVVQDRERRYIGEMLKLLRRKAAWFGIKEREADP